VSATHQLDATPDTCFWGYFDQSLAPALKVAPGDSVDVRALTHHAGDAPDLMMDDGVRAIWDAVREGDRGPGVHIMTGPIAVAGAEPGGVVSVRIESTAARLPYGSTASAHWGALHDRFGEEWVTIWRLDDVGPGQAVARPAFSYDFTTRPLYDLPGVITEPDPAARTAWPVPVTVPVRPHFGVLGVAPAEPGRVSSVPPGVHGGNIDNWRLGAGATLHLPVFVPGGLVYVGDPHASQGDGEVCGTAVESSMDARLVLGLADLPGDVVDAPILETDTHWFTHGFDPDLDVAMTRCVERMLVLLEHLYGLPPKLGYALLSVGGDVGVTQVVDGNKGCHTGVAKAIFAA
jgi:acetamidase/formamidase